MLASIASRYAVLIGLVFTLTLAPTILGQRDSANAVTKAQCQQRYVDCDLKCSARAGRNNNISQDKSQANQERAGADYAACTQRTCSHQLKGCMASASDASKQSLTKQGPARTQTLGGGVLDRSQPLNPVGPAATGTPVAPTAPPVQLR